MNVVPSGCDCECPSHSDTVDEEKCATVPLRTDDGKIMQELHYDVTGFLGAVVLEKLWGGESPLAHVGLIQPGMSLLQGPG